MKNKTFLSKAMFLGLIISFLAVSCGPPKVGCPINEGIGVGAGKDTKLKTPKKKAYSLFPKGMR